MKLLIRALVAASVAVFLSGLAACGQKALDYRNAQIVNGKFYAGDANEAFSGQLTNVPSGVILGSQQGFRNAVVTLEKTLWPPPVMVSAPWTEATRVSEPPPTRVSPEPAPVIVTPV